MKYNKEGYIKLLAKTFKNENEVLEEIINLKAILELPKGTEVFLSDVHGEYEPFIHVLNNGAGRIRNKIDLSYKGILSLKERNKLATLIYYPEEKLKQIKDKNENTKEWYIDVISRLVEICRMSGGKYTRSKVIKAIPKFTYIMDELLHAPEDVGNKAEYYEAVIKSIIELGIADEVIIAISEAIKQMSIDHLHIVGDIFDRGIHPDYILERLMQFHSVDIEWGNHDILWMGATLGNMACIANVIRICARYGNIRILEDTYGINMRPLSIFALDTYKEVPPKRLLPRELDYNKYSESDKIILAKIQKAIAVIQFKIEGQLIKEHPEYNMNDRLLLDKIDYEKGTVNICGIEYELNDTSFPTIDKNDPYKLTDTEQELIERLRESFMESTKLNEHIKFLYAKGSTYKIFNSNLLMHACIPINEDGSYTKITLLGETLSGKEYLDHLDKAIRKAYFEGDKESADYMWYLWCGKDSPFFGKDKMTTFEQYFVDDKASHKEHKIPYYEYIIKEEFCQKILKDFGINEEFSHIINGHVPVKAKDGESPVKANGKLLVIDGGFAKGYREKTGEAGFILSYNSYGLMLNANKTFESIQKVIETEDEVPTEIIVSDHIVDRKRVGDTDIGAELKEQIECLTELLKWYRNGKM